MPNSQYDVERATAGLVMALFVAAALLLAALLYFVLRDMDERAADESASEPQAVRVAPPAAPERPVADPAVSLRSL
jgi:hypothetical protein